MSTQDTRKVVSRAVMDEGFRTLLFSDPEKALAGYDLTADEMSALRAIPAETIDDFASHLDERISMSVLAFGAEAFGGAAYGAEASGGAAMGGDAYGGEAAGSDAYGSDAMGGDAYGGEAAGGDAYGADAYGSDAMGGDAYGGEAAGSDAYGSDAMGGDAFGGDAAGGDAMGGGESQVAQSQPASWLVRLSNALGIHSTGAASGKVDYY